MLLLVGLGNPGPKYEKNRHNIGFMAVDDIVRRHSFGPWKARFQGQIAEGRLGGEKVLALKPTTFMNESGRAVGEALRFYKLEAADVIVVYDELDVAPGKIKVKQGGGHGGHNGLRSLDAHIGKDYWRVRLGIGHPGDKSRVHGHVLGDFAKVEMPTVERVIDAVSNAIPALVEEGAPAFSTKAALVLKPPQNQNREKDGASTATKPAPVTKKDKDTAVSTALAQAMAKAKGLTGGDNS